jgi:hypothetical protein
MWCPPSHVADFLDRHHYLGATARGLAWMDRFGVLVVAPPTSRRLPTNWLELTRWCLTGARNGGSQQWAAVARELLTRFPTVTTIVSYSDPSAGHTGALYRAANWLWAPTWHRLRPPPTGNGAWADGQPQSVKDRWVYLLRRDAGRADVLQVNDASLQRRECYTYHEPKRRLPEVSTSCN